MGRITATPRVLHGIAPAIAVLAALLGPVPVHAHEIRSYETSEAWGVAVGPDGSAVFTTSWGVGRIDPSGTVTPGWGGTEFAWQITYGPDGNLWFTDGGSRIQRIASAGQITSFPLPHTLSKSYGITTGPDGRLWYTDSGTNRIGRMTTAGDLREFVLPRGGGLGGITSGPDGNLWFVEPMGNRIGRITTAGEISEFDLATPNSAPLSIAAGSDGNVWFTMAAARIGRISPDGRIVEFPLPGPAVGLTTGVDGNLWLLGYDRLMRMTPGGLVTSFEVPIGGRSPTSIAAGSDGSIWFTTSDGWGGGTVVRFALDTSVCEADRFTLCLNDGHFRVAASFQTRDGVIKKAGAQAFTSASGYFWFFDEGNVEVVVKVLNACSLSGTSWVFAAGLTNVATELTVTDTRTGATRTYTNPGGSPFEPVHDTGTFPCP